MAPASSVAFPAASRDSAGMAEVFDAQTTREITQLLRRSASGEADAFGLAVERLYPELRRLAGWHAGNSAQSTLGATAVLHEAYLKIAASDNAFDNRAHFMSVASKAMRQIIIDYARRRSAQKRGGDLQPVQLEDASGAVDGQAVQLLMLDEMLTELARKDERAARVFECRFFGGLTDAETAAGLDLPVRTVQRAWSDAKRVLAAAWERED